MQKPLLLACMLLLCAPAFAQPERRARKSDALDFRHSISFTPISGIVAYKELNPAAGLTYEYIISREAGIGINIPIMLGYAGPERAYLNNTQYKHSVIYAAPGIRFHTGRRNSTVDFATGPAVLIGNQHFSPDDSYYYGGTYPNYNNGPAFNRTMVGLVADNSLNFYRSHFNFGFDVRVGTMLERQQDTRFFIHFGMHFGGIF